MEHIYIFGAILFTVYGQMVLKWRVAATGSSPANMTGKLWLLFNLVLNPWVISGMAAAFLAFLCWMTALTHFDLSYAYPFTSMAFPLVLLLSWLFFNEAVNKTKIFGTILIMIGIIMIGQA